MELWNSAALIVVYENVGESLVNVALGALAGVDWQTFPAGFGIFFENLSVTAHGEGIFVAENAQVVDSVKVIRMGMCDENGI